MSNEIIRPVTPDGNAGFDQFGQFTIRTYDGDHWTQSIYADVRESKCPICQKGWELSAPALKDQHYDHTFEEHSHNTCYVGYLAASEGHRFVDVLCKTRDAAQLTLAFSLKKIPNEYHAAWDTPWYLVSMRGYIPTIKFGTRKRVWNMELLDLTKAQTEMFLPMLDEHDRKNTNQTTGTGVMIHAWSWEEIAKYLGYFFKIVTVDKPKDPENEGAIVTSFSLNK